MLKTRIKWKNIALILFIILGIFIFKLIAQAKKLQVSTGDYNLNIYNVAIVGNSHASYMSNFVEVDNDLLSLTVGNHSVAGDDLISSGTWHQVTMDYRNNAKLICEGQELRGWVNKFIEDSPKIDYAICWFGSNTLGRTAEYFDKQYRDWIDKVREVSNCKLILMPIPYAREGVERENAFTTYEIPNVDSFNVKIRKIAKDYADKNVVYQELPDNITYTDKLHLSRETYSEIWETIKKKYKIKVEIVESEHNIDSYKISHMGSWRGEEVYELFKHNSEEAFINSGLAGFYACEGDLRYSPELDLFYMSHDVPAENTITAIKYCCKFETYLDLCKQYGMRPLIDMKEWSYYDKMWTIVCSKNMQSDVICQQNSSTPTKWLSERGAATCNLLSKENIDDGSWLAKTNEIKSKLINVEHKYLTQDIIDIAHDHGIKVCVYSLDDSESRFKFLEMGVDYIMTNRNY